MKTKNKRTNTKNKDTNRILIKILKKLLLIVLLLMVAYNLVYFVFSAFNINMSFFGINFFVVNSNSMKPTLKQKDLIIAKKVQANNLKQEDIIVYLKDKDYRITRIINVHENREIFSYVIKGDNNYYAEEILEGSVQGKMLANIPMGGILINILRSKILTVIIFLYILLMYRYKKRIKLKKEKRNRRRETLEEKTE